MHPRPVYRRFAIALVALASLVAVAPVAADFTPLILTAEPAPQSHVIDGMPALGQWWNLSCEYAATSAATAFYGATISQQTFADDIGFDPNPNIAFRGRLSGPWGGTTDYGIYPAPILRVLMARGFPHSYRFQADTGLLRAAIARDHPVVVWIVGTFGSAPRYEEEREGARYLLVPYEHAVTAYGYNESGIMLMDPAIGGYRTVAWPTFIAAWTQLDGMALVVAP